MSSNPIILRPGAQPEGAPLSPGGFQADPFSPPPPPQQNLATVVHRLLRGQYPMVITLAAACGLAGAVVGYFSQVPKYRSDAFVQIQPSLPKILYQTEQSSISPMFSSFVNTQMNLLQQDRVITRAMNSPAWRELGRGRGPEDELKFRKSLRVVTVPNSLLINVSFTDKQSRATLVAVQEVIGAYQEIFGGSEDKNFKEMQVNTLNALRDRYEGERRDLQHRVSERLKEFETDDLVRLQDHYLTQLLTLDSRVTELGLQLTEMGIDPDRPASTPSAGQPESPAAAGPTAEEIAATDPDLARLLAEQAILRRRLARNRALGYGDQHPSIVADEVDLAALDAAISEIMARYAGHAAPGSVTIRPRGEQLVEQYRGLKDQLEKTRVKTESIKVQRIAIEGLNRDIASTDAKLTEINQRLEEISVESKVRDQVGRIESILPDGEPGTPTVNPRPRMAAFGLVLGGGIPIAVMLVLGLIDRRFRYADQARDATRLAPLLGILPELPSQDGDPEQRAAAVHCVHHIRSLLQMAQPARKVFALTSPTAGDGKTSLALSLAMSFTASGGKTLLVDFDLVGCGLSSRLGVRRDQGLGHALVRGRDNGLVIPTGVPGLDLIPAGRNDARCASGISLGAFAAVIDEHRAKYDSIIIDTGPALGSLEANIAATTADGVLLVVGRGQRGDRVQEVLSHLDRLGATLVGMVFNRAYATDFARSTMSKSFRSVRGDEPPSSPSPPPPSPPPDPSAGSIAPGDPLARSVVADIRR